MSPKPNVDLAGPSPGPGPDDRPSMEGTGQDAAQDPLPMRVFLVRHGVTWENSDGQRLGRLDVGLNHRGLEQARQLAGRSRELRLAAVWTSPLARARRTAEVVADALNLPLREDPRLGEMALGPWEGLREAEIEERFPAEYAIWARDPESLEMPGHEGLRATRERAVAAIQDILAAGERALCVTHLTVLRVLWTHYERRELNEFAAITPEHGELFGIACEDGRTGCRSVSWGEP